MKKSMKLCLAIVSLSALTATYAANPGSYLGLGLGAGKQETANLDLSNPAGIKFNQSRTEGGLAGRLFAGHNFNENFGIETGFTQYSNAKTKFYSKNTTVGKADGSRTYEMASFDVVGKAYLPISEGMNLYGLGGAALVHTKAKTNVSTTNRAASVAVSSIPGNQSHYSVRPVVGFGASYDIPQTAWTTGLEYSHTFGKGNVKNSANAIPAASLVTFNVAYNLG